jgi:acyl carrier protein
VSSATLLLELKQLIAASCERPVDPASIQDDELLFGPEARLALDSLDALQVSMAIQKETRRLLSCVANLAQVLETHLAARS